MYNLHMDGVETATIAGGYFWCTEAIFKRLKGVKSVVPGYGGGNVKNPSYEQICSGSTGHAEAIQIEFDPTELPYDKLLEIFFHLHDPTTLNRQGNDVGTQYRSAIFYRNDEQKQKAEEVKKKIGESGYYKDKIVTEIVPFTNFYEAEDYHKNYFDRNKDAAYCNYVIDPKIRKLIDHYSENVKEEYKKGE